jgi:ABC-type Fe3+ transport system substrate-binding protein
LRKEGLNALLELTAAGEFDAVIPANASSVQQKLPSGAPLGFFCPEPVPASVEEAIILKRAPHGNAAKIFLNWTLSKEGQIFDFASSSSAPVHSGLRRRESLPFADEILGKEISYRDPLVQFEVLPRLEEYWNNLWLGKR